MNIIYKAFPIIIDTALLAVLLSASPAFAISGECSSHNGVNCAASSLTGDAVCNDGWISSVPYSETDECKAAISCLTSSEVTQMTQLVQQEYQPIIQNLENEEQQAVAEQQQANQAQTEGTAQSAAMLSQYHGVNSAMTQYWSDLASKQQQAISDTEAQYQLSITSAQNKMALMEAEVQAEQCTPQQQTYLNYVSSTDTCFAQNGLNPNCLNQQSANGCASGYAGENGTCESIANICGPNSNSIDPISHSCVCDTGYEESGLGCVPIPSTNQGPTLAACQSEFGQNAAVQNGSCGCAAGYEVNSDLTQCVAIPPSTPTLTTSNLPQGNSAVAATSSSPQTFTINQNLNFGASGNSVVSLQQFLMAKGFLTLPAGTSNGYFGNLTKQALISYQKSVSLPTTGYCGPMTRAMINQ